MFSVSVVEWCKRVITSSKAKSCQLDPISPSGCNDALLSIVTTNTLLWNKAIFLKIESIVHPSIKKPTFDPEDNNNFKPISNLPLLSKTIYRGNRCCSIGQLTDHQLYAKMQSAYRKHHSTETELLRVVNDINNATGDENECVMVLLDLSPAFNTTDHKILIKRLEKRYGFPCLALEWLKSYLQERSQ